MPTFLGKTSAISAQKSKTHEKKIVADLLQLAGVSIDGVSPWDIKVKDDRLYPALLREGSLGLGESYVDGWWDCEEVDQLIGRLIRADLENKVRQNKKFLFCLLLGRFVNFQNHKRSFEVGRVHYDIAPDLYRKMLDAEMNYSCGYWKNATTLDEAQKAKLELSCRKLKLAPGMKVLDIGCGFGAFAKYAAKNYKVHVVGVTVSEQQALWAKENCKGYPVEIRFQDYRDVTEKFDRVISIGMFEHVGKKNYKDYMSLVFKSLIDDGLFLLHTIGTTCVESGTDAWISKYIFPNSILPAARDITDACRGKFVIEDWHDFGLDYVKTLRAWYDNFTSHWHSLRNNYDQRFFRMWTYYLLSFMGSFQVKHIQVWQVVLSKNYLNRDYSPIR
ncbi:MAG: cyclopropane fatty acyl phospholipid synthase [Desulfocapsaceae bacterium]|nr:cyclopropane fatty acyl phospholipid synthase [Desulfocapsaceae bacterium]